MVHTGQVDEVWICPTGPRPDLPQLASPSQRLAMCEIAVNQCTSPTTPIRVVDHEVREASLVGPDGTVATYDSLVYLREHHPGCDICFLVGADKVGHIASWGSQQGRTGERIFEEFEILVQPRPGFEVDFARYASRRVTPLRLPSGFAMAESNGESREVRKRAMREWSSERQGGNNMAALNGLVAPGVLAFIVRHRIYEPPGLPPLPPRASKKKVALVGGAFSPFSARFTYDGGHFSINRSRSWAVPSRPSPRRTCASRAKL